MITRPQSHVLMRRYGNGVSNRIVALCTHPYARWQSYNCRLQTVAEGFQKSTRRLKPCGIPSCMQLKTPNPSLRLGAKYAP